MKIKIIENTVCDGVAVEVGSVVETDERSATLLVALKRAEYVQKSDAKAAKKSGGLNTKSAGGLVE